jgi:hypothetical protein
MKRFKIEGWYRYNDEKDFEVLELRANNLERAIIIFNQIFREYNFYKIDIKEIV